MKCVSILILIIFILSCQTLPLINPSVFVINENASTCPFPFLEGKYRLIHSIENRMFGETQSVIIGVTLIDSSTRRVSCAIITAEGMVLFEAESGPDTLKVNRALPPFDSEDFAKNVIEDIKLIFFAPEGRLHEKGTLADSTMICRYQEENGDWIDVIDDKLKGIAVKRYSPNGILKRQIKFKKIAGDTYQNIELQAYETFNYSLLMNLIEAQKVEKNFPRAKHSRETKK
ncbi:MAG: hypothetical protein APR62_07040 [Smithella sp. SDB]|nr:MAG: hypothetical protein APR62_07040 [Smithella sp. SDB]